MADEKQLTVAELLARNSKGRAGADSEGGSRRRRRSLEDGGVSVAELTGNLEKVKATPAESKHSNVSIDETAPVIPAPKQEQDEKQAADAKAKGTDKVAGEVAEEKAADKSADKASQPSTDDTRVIKRVTDKPEAKQDAKDAKAEAAKADFKDDSKAPKAAAATTAAAGTTAAGAGAAMGDSVPVKAQEKDLLETESDADYEEDDEKLNPFSVLLLALVGIVLGAIVFKGFEILWDSFSRSIVAILAVAVTALMVALVHVLRTNRDGASMALAAFVGLVLTFGPLLIVM
ncbi:Yip1 family protein [Corynebacterium sp. c25Ua_89]|uniref:Yip1 family protein n=1 Tax=Corynebacterium sp. c25Ua_89 TaxID=3032356 RepID=UPI0039C4ABB9